MTGSFACTSAAVRSFDGRNMLLLEPLVFTRPNGQVVTVPAGATADGASVPGVLWSSGLAPFGMWWLAALLHDAAYRAVLDPPASDRLDADLLFWEGMRAAGVSERTARILYNGVRLGGELAWREHHK